MSFKLTTFETSKTPNGLNLTVNTDLIEKFCKIYESITREAKTVKIVTCIGKYGIGKSTTLNAILSNAFKRNFNPFQSANLGDSIKRRINANNHLEGSTYGMDAIIITITPQEIILFIDVQGLFSSERIADPAVMLFCYRISDLFIINVQEKFGDDTLDSLDLITEYAQYFKQASNIHKPKLLFRLINAQQGSTDPILNAAYNSMMSGKGMYKKMTQLYAETYFSKPEPPFVWSERPDSSHIQEYDRTQDTLKFINHMPHYPHMCGVIVSLLLNMEARNFNLSLDLINHAKFINENFSNLTFGPIIINESCSDERMRQWLSKELGINGKYHELTQMLTIMSCSHNDQILIKTREERINNFNAEFNLLFANSPDVNYGMQISISRIHNIYKQMLDIFNNHKTIATREIKSSVRNMMISIVIRNSDNNCINSSVFEDILNQASGKLNISYDISNEIIIEIRNQERKIAQIFNQKHEEFITNTKSKLNTFKQHLMEQKQKFMININKYIESLELTYRDIVDLYLYELQSTFKIIVDKTIAARISHFKEAELKIHDIDSLDSNGILSKIIHFDIEYDSNSNMIGLNPGLEINEYISYEQYDHEINKLFDELRNLCISYENKFATNRQKALKDLLPTINKKTYEERHIIYEKIKHNSLCMFDFDLTNHHNVYEHETFMKDPVNTEIATFNTFNGKFSGEIMELYKVYRNSDNLDKKNYIKNEILRLLTIRSLRAESKLY